MEKIDWEEVKKILCSIVDDLKNICNKIPDGNIKNILCGIISILEMLCAVLED